MNSASIKPTTGEEEEESLTFISTSGIPTAMPASGTSGSSSVGSVGDGSFGGTAAGGAGGGISGNEGVVGYFRRANHPVAAVFHVLFKFTAILLYFFSSLIFSDSFVMSFVIIVILLAFDFWTVKNITGRLMVGLRWWNEIADDGSNKWRFESIDNVHEVGVIDRTIFWYSMYLAMSIWLIFSFFALIKINIEYMLICGVGVVLNFSNLYGYYKCSKDAQEKLQSVMSQSAMSVISGVLARSAAISATPAPLPNV